MIANADRMKERAAQALDGGVIEAKDCTAFHIVGEDNSDEKVLERAKAFLNK